MNLRMPESKSGALPLGDTPTLKCIISQDNAHCKCFFNGISKMFIMLCNIAFSEYGFYAASSFDNSRENEKPKFMRSTL